ncbi:hypothetical protein DPMN_010760 [Dreissena polymorpha]|uniref:Uncharacterized protein n=1 Tax=Dreissena polymorpha TaxID=45954 RepID=A0A9D4MZB0_DREPO|nr:hypothetical protein DPMN_010760 [Dreissena polymorpha]
MATSSSGRLPYMAVAKPCELSRSHKFCQICLKLAQKICCNDFLGKYFFLYVEKHDHQEMGQLLYTAIVKSCKHSEGHILCHIFMKHAQNICFCYITAAFENGSGLFINMLQGGGAVFLTPGFTETL